MRARVSQTLAIGTLAEGFQSSVSSQDVSSRCQAAASTPAAAQPVQAAPVVATGSEGEKLFAELKALDADSSKERCVWKVPDL